jgi:hypothetical protein
MLASRLFSGSRKQRISVRIQAPGTTMLRWSKLSE